MPNKRKASNQGGKSPKRTKRVTFAVPNNAPVAMPGRKRMSSPPRSRTVNTTNLLKNLKNLFGPAKSKK